MHRDPCRYGADIGLTPRSPGWLTERGLSLHLVDAPFHLRLPAPHTRTSPVNYDLFRRRQQHSGLSLWELGDLLGIHPHHLHVYDTSGALIDQPVRVLCCPALKMPM